MNKSAGIRKQLNAQQQVEVDKLLEGFELPEIDIGALGKKVVIAVIDYVQEKVLPGITAKNAQLGFLLSAMLEGIENALK